MHAETPITFFIMATIFLLSSLNSTFSSVVITKYNSNGTSRAQAGINCAGSVRPESCPVSCFRSTPVCGVDGVTYWCGCSEALCAGAEVAKMGFCEVGSTGSDPVTGQALLLVHIIWLIVLGFSVLLGFL